MGFRVFSGKHYLHLESTSLSNIFHLSHAIIDPEGIFIGEKKKEGGGGEIDHRFFLFEVAKITSVSSPQPQGGGVENLLKGFQRYFNETYFLEFLQPLS